MLLVDTVGFIQKLPHSLVAAFRATLEEVNEADLLLHVVDASAEDLEERESAVEAVLSEIGASAQPRIVVLNKADRTPPERLQALAAGRPGAVVVSAVAGDGLDARRSRSRRGSTSFPGGSSCVCRRRGVVCPGSTRPAECSRTRTGRGRGPEADLPVRALDRYREQLL